MEEPELILSNVVRFELPGYAGPDGLCTRLRSRWPGTKRRKGNVWLVSARLRATEGDLALLLREVESYVADAGLHAIRFQLDGRSYILAAPTSVERPLHAEGAPTSSA